MPLRARTPCSSRGWPIRRFHLALDKLNPTVLMGRRLLTWMGAACLHNARGCGRLHCYLTWPYFLLLALISLLYGVGVVPLGARPVDAVGRPRCGRAVPGLCSGMVVWSTRCLREEFCWPFSRQIQRSVRAGTLGNTARCERVRVPTPFRDQHDDTPSLTGREFWTYA